MNKETRQKIFDKYNDCCAYTGKSLGENWQVDHMLSIYQANYISEKEKVVIDYNHIDNLVPALRIINHYKSAKNVESFREYMKSFHLRLKKLPKKTTLEKTRKRIIYMNAIAEAFGITVDKPFNGIFYFETLIK